MCAPLLDRKLLFIIATLFSSAGAAQGARVAHEGFPSPGLMDIVLRLGGHEPTALTAGDVAGGALLTGNYNVFVVGRGTPQVGASALYLEEVGKFVAAGGNIVTEFAGMALFFSSYSPDARIARGPQLGTFSGVVHGGSGIAFMTLITALDPSHPTVAGLPNPFGEPDGTEYFFWPETADPDLRVIADFVGNGVVDMPFGQRLPCILVGCKGGSTFVFGTFDWYDTVGGTGVSRVFLQNAVNFAAAGCNSPPITNIAGPYIVECEGGTSSVTLDGSGSIDPEGRPLTFAWSTDCPMGSFDNPQSPRPVLTLDTSFGCSLVCNVTLTVSDGSQERSSSTTVTVQDTRPPMIALNGPGMLVLQCHYDTYLEEGATASDACDPAVSVMIGGGPIDNTVLGTYLLTYDAQDSCGNSAIQVTRTVEVMDHIPPMFTALPLDLTVECEGSHGVSSAHPAIVTFLGMAQVSDACDKFSLAHDAPLTFPLGSTPVTWTATDLSGNMISASRAVRVADTAPPTLVRPADVTFQGPADTSVASTGMASASDTCEASPTVSYSDLVVNECSGTGTISRTLTAMDGSGNSVSSVQTIRVIDTTPPQVSCSVTAQSSGNQDIVVNFSAWDSCSQASVSAVVETDCIQIPVLNGDLVQLSCLDFECAGSASHVARLMVTAVDGCGNQSTAYADVLISGCDTPLVQFRRGDANGDERLNLADALYLLEFHFKRKPAPDCMDAADANDDGKVDLKDAIFLLNFLLNRKGQIPPPFPGLGTDPTADGLDCKKYPSHGDPSDHFKVKKVKSKKKVEKKFYRKLARYSAPKENSRKERD